MPYGAGIFCRFLSRKRILTNIWKRRRSAGATAALPLSWMTVPPQFLRMGINPALNSGFLGFVVVDAGERGKGYGKEMLRLAVKYAFEIASVQSLALNVFDCNKAAMGLYRNIGFEETALTPECFVFMMKNGEDAGWRLKKNEEKIMLTETFDKDTEQMISRKLFTESGKRFAISALLPFLMWWWKR